MPFGPVVADSKGSGVLKLAVTAPPAGGRANSAVVEVLAKTWHLPKRAIEITRGAHDRDKATLIHGDTEALMATLTAWLNDNGTDIGT